MRAGQLQTESTHRLSLQTLWFLYHIIKSSVLVPRSLCTTIKCVWTFCRNSTNAILTGGDPIWSSPSHPLGTKIVSRSTTFVRKKNKREIAKEETNHISEKIKSPVCNNTNKPHTHLCLHFELEMGRIQTMQKIFLQEDTIRSTRSCSIDQRSSVFTII